MMKISIIIPILNEAGNIRNTIKMLERLRGDKEIIFVDGGSSDGTPSLIPAYFRVISSERGRAKQMNKGTGCASGEALLFLHCDSILEPEALEEIERILGSGFAAGCYCLKFDRADWLISIIAYLSNVRVRLLKIMFGDQGIFIKKEIFERLGGFADIPLMEDLEISVRLKKEGRIKQSQSKIITSSRRFTDKGTLKTIVFMHKLKLLYWLGKSPEKLSRLYRDVR